MLATLLFATAEPAAVRLRPLNDAPMTLEQRLAKLRAGTHNPNAQLAHVKPQGLVPGLSMFVHDPAECRYISRTLLRAGQWEPHLLGEIVTTLQARPGERFLDIGANIGSYSLAVAAAGFRAVAVEPMQYNVELLMASAAAARLWRNLTLFKSAVSATAAAEPMCVVSHDRSGRGNKGNGQLALLSECAAAGASGSAAGGAPAYEVVSVSTVDSLLASRPQQRRSKDGDEGSECFAAAKIDVEGFEVEALLGAAGVFGGRCPPCLVVVEYVPYNNVSAVVTDEGRRRSINPLPLLHSHGYRCGKRDASRHYRCRHPRCGGKVSAHADGRMDGRRLDNLDTADGTTRSR